MLLSLVLACTTEEEASAPYGMPLVDDGQLYAGVARIDVTPTILETFTDVDGDNEFDGCDADPEATATQCTEPYDDVDGDRHFDALFMAGFGSPRPALDVHDPLTVTALVLALDREYVALVGVDAIGLLENRTRDARDLVEADGFDRDRLLINSSHAHSSVDTVGIWGMDEVSSGADPDFLESVVAAIHESVSSAASEMQPVSPNIGVADFAAPEFNGAPFGGTNPDPSIEAGLNDIRDPVITAGQVLTLAFDGADGARVATLVSASGHPEVSDSDHNSLSADYPGVVRDWIDGTDGGTTLFLSGALGGMQSALGSTLPYVDEAGARVLDGEGNPEWLHEGGFEFVRVWGTLMAQAAQGSLGDTQSWDKLRVRKVDYLVPVDNVSFKLAFQLKLLDTPHEYINQTPDCPGYGVDLDVFGCVPASSWVVELGPATFGSVPGELFPELFWGVPDEPSMSDASIRTDDRRWVQFDEDCADVDWNAVCKDEDEVAVATDCDGPDGLTCDGVCSCLLSHAVPYTLSDTAPTPIADLLPGTYKFPLGITNAYCGYIVPGPDFNTWVDVTKEQADHYEETNSCSGSFGDLVLGAFSELSAP